MERKDDRMEKEPREPKKPISHEKIYKIMIGVPLGVSFLFFVKNVTAGSVAGALTIGICMFLLIGILLGMGIKKVKAETKEFVLAIALLLLIFTISLNSGASYSDDFPMYLAVIGLTGLYLEPRITRIQIIIADVLFVGMYVIHPEKAESLSQFILCEVIFTLAGFLFYLTIKRGRAFTEISEERAKEAEMLLDFMRGMGTELDQNFTASSKKIEDSTNGLKTGSASITQGANDVSDNCEQVHAKIQETESQIEALNDELQSFETALQENRTNVEAMNGQVRSVSVIIKEANQVFKAMEQQMNEINVIAKELSNISFNTTILSLNASIEAARAGDVGSGFAVVAGRMRELSVNSDMFSEQVSEVVSHLLEQVDKTAKQFVESNEALEQSEVRMQQLQSSFERLQEQFISLYSNIEQQNYNISQVDYIFDTLKDKVLQMHGYSVNNQEAVESIVEAMDIYKENISRVIESTQKV